MQIDFHHAVTYVTARIAGFEHKEADIIAYAAQYVDDATSNGTICFDNKAMYTRISSAHKTVDVKNLNNVENHMVWLPFHFLPGNAKMEAGKSPDGGFVNKLICRPDSLVADDMLQNVYNRRGYPYDLHGLGIAMHVYADTWAHQGFAGILHDVNEVEDAQEINSSGHYKDTLHDILNSILEDAIPPLGHGRANVFPDMPFLSWKYKNGKGELIERNNTDLFCTAAEALCKAMKKYRGAPDATGIGNKDMEIIRSLFTGLKMEKGEDRHIKWLESIKEGVFSFGTAEVSYAEDGKNSWKAQALGNSCDQMVYSYSEKFLTSNWKLFHDAVQLHRLTLLHDILPKYGICAA